MTVGLFGRKQPMRMYTPIEMVVRQRAERLTEELEVLAADNAAAAKRLRDKAKELREELRALNPDNGTGHV